jgi:16S rRNA processing protein RimM
LDSIFLIADIKSAYGSEGYVRINSYSDIPNRFSGLKQVQIDVFGDYRNFFVEEISSHKNNVILKFCNFNSAEEVNFLIGKKIYIQKGSSRELPNNFHFIHDLIGSKVFRNDKFFGYLIDVLNLPANDVYVIKDINGEEVLLPAVEDYIESFDDNEKKLILREGSEPFYDDED